MIPGWGPQDRRGLTAIAGGVTAAAGVRANGATSGIKASGAPDLALVVTDEAAVVAVVTTQNLVKAPSCRVSERHAANGRARAVVINSGNANVCTPDDVADTKQMVGDTAQTLAIAVDDVLVMSTGVIGEPLPIDRIRAALPELAAGLADDGGDRAATAIMTTDTRSKQAAYRVTDANGATCVVGGMAKGVGMIEPNMATLLVVLTTDAPLTPDEARTLLTSSVGRTFNRISVDGDGSTSDSAALLATGEAPNPPGPGAVATALHAVCADLAHAVVSDGEGASRVAAITVTRASNDHEAEQLARSIATSLLVRAAIHGADPNWGRILMAMGSAQVGFDPRRVQVTIAGTTVCRNGVGVTFDRDALGETMRRDLVEILVDVDQGGATVTMLTCDLTPEYVRFNAEYTT